MSDELKRKWLEMAKEPLFWASLCVHNAGEPTLCRDINCILAAIDRLLECSGTAL